MESLRKAVLIAKVQQKTPEKVLDVHEVKIGDFTFFIAETPSDRIFLESRVAGISHQSEVSVKWIEW